MIKIFIAILLISASFWTYNWYTGKTAPSVVDTTETKKGEAIAYFAGGCFWCVESDYEKLPEVKEVISGYMGGNIDNPSYKQVSSGETGHREAVKIVYDPNKTTYRDLVLHLLRHTDPTDTEGSFFDRGFQYTSAVYYQNEEEKEVAQDVIKEVENRKVFNKPIATSIEPAGEFWLAEDYHQDFYKKSSVRYKYYRNGSGRDNFIENAWGNGEHDDLFEENDEVVSKWENYQKPDDATLKETLTDIQYKITQKEGTETPFQNEYWDNHEDGLYVDIVSGEPLFSSTDKFDSGTGWPSFLKPLNKDFVVEKKDYKLIIPRTEIRSKYADSHLGHIILDGPIENDKIRYCMNSAALRFVPKDELEKEGLGEYMSLFSQSAQ